MSAPRGSDEAVLIALVERADSGAVRVLAPAVGWWLDPPRRGSLAGGGSSIGRLERLNRRFRLVLPDGVAGVVGGDPPRDRRVAVQFGQPLLELAPVGDVAGSAADPSTASRREDVPEGAWAVVAPTDGVFYRRPSPDAPAFVELGTRIHGGQPVGLVEAMKTFNQIVYGGPGFPDEAEVVEIRCEDAAEVRSGQVLLVVR